jgi:hypothetical protein
MSLYLLPSKTGCGMYQLKGNNCFYLMTIQELQIIYEVLINLQYILQLGIEKYFFSKSKYFGNFYFGGYLATLNYSNEAQIKNLENLNFKKLHTFFNYNEDIYHLQGIYFLETNMYQKGLKLEDQKIKYEVLFR